MSLYTQGDHKAAFEILLCTKLRFPTNSAHCQLWMLQEHLLHYRRAMHHGNFSAAEKAIFNLSSVNEAEANLWQVLATELYINCQTYVYSFV